LTDIVILTGAVMFGIDPTVIGVRRSRLTYGVGVLHRFLLGKHPSSKKITKDNSSWCKDVFDRFVAVDQEVRRNVIAAIKRRRAYFQFFF